MTTPNVFAVDFDSYDEDPSPAPGIRPIAAAGAAQAAPIAPPELEDVRDPGNCFAQMSGNPHLRQFMRWSKIEAGDLRAHGPRQINCVSGLAAVITASDEREACDRATLSAERKGPRRG